MTIEEVLTRDLNDQQRGVVLDPGEIILCLACAGSGKTRTLAYRTARLIQDGVAPRSIVAFTFTEKAAESLKRQIASALAAVGTDPTLVGAMYVGTIHAYCQYVLGEIDARFRQFDVLDENRLKLYLVSRYPQLGLHNLRDQRRARYFQVIREASDAWKMMNDELLDPAEVARHDPQLGAVLHTMASQLDQDEFIDFSLMIRLVVEALQQNHVDALRAVADVEHLMVDEYQDVNTSQEQLIRELRGRIGTLLVVGDDDQAIYAWRGADVSNILSFTDRYPGASSHTLSHNYRSTRAVVQTADAFAAAELGATRIGKNPSADDTEGPRQVGSFFFDRREHEAEWVADRIASLMGSRYRERDGTERGLTPGDCAILMRSTRSRESDGRPRHAVFTDALAARGIPFSLEAGGGVFDRPQVRALANSFELLRQDSPSRETVRLAFDSEIVPAFPAADFELTARAFAEWGRLIHAPHDGVRRRVFPQQLVHDFLHAYGVHRTDFDMGVLSDLGVFSRVMQDVESVYLSIDSARRFQEILNFLSNVAETGYDSGTSEVLRRPDAVTVSTVHKIKGLEFPIVAVVDVESARFPGPNYRYSKWMPPALVQGALDREAYRGSRAGEARLFYTALTRAERYLYVSGSESLPGGVKRWRPSPFSQRLAHDEIVHDPAALPAGVVEADPRPRVDETVVPTSYSEIRYYLKCPRDYLFRRTFGFSPPIAEMFGFGRTVHTAVTKLHQVFRDRPPTADEAREIAGNTFHLKHVPPSRDPEHRPGGYERARESAEDIAGAYAETYREDFLRRRQVEVRFEVPIRQAVISGAIDLMLQVDDEGNIEDAHVIDFKAMEGGANPVGDADLHWTELSLQVQLYAKAARAVLGENARTGSVHLLKDNQRVEVPVDDEAMFSAVANVEWAIGRILAGDFPMRPDRRKCERCDFRLLCAQDVQEFEEGSASPPPIRLPQGGQQMARAFSEFDGAE